MSKSSRLFGMLSAVALASSMSAAADVIHVRADATGSNDGSTWADAFRHLQDGLAAAQPGDQIWVAIGEYRPDQSSSPAHPAPPTPGDRNATFQLLNDVSIYGGFDGTEASLASRAGAFERTILSGDLLRDDGPAFANNGDNSLHVTTGTGTSATARLDGFTVTAGHADMLFTFRGGAGMLNNPGSPSVSRVTFLENIASGFDGWPITRPYGGGMFNLGSSSPLLEACSFVGNAAIDGGAIDNDDRGAPVLIDCVFLDNIAFGEGGALFNLGSDTVLIRCRFEGNTATENGGAIINFGGSDLTMLHCRFLGNSAGLSGGALFHNGGQGEVLDVNGCVFSGNTSAAMGGAIVNLSAEAYLLTDSTLSANTAGTSGGGVYSTGPLTIANSILWGNSDAGGVGESAQIDDAAGLVSVDHSCVEGWTGTLGGTGNIGSDPLFVDADGRDDTLGTDDDNLRLAAQSPCIDAADNAAVPADTTDLDGDGYVTEPAPADVDGLVRFWEDVATTDTGAGAAPIVDMGAYEFHEGAACQVDLGFQGPGNVILNLCGRDLMQAGATATLQLAGAPPVAPVYLIIGLSNQPTPMLGGTLVPVPPAAVIDGLLTDANGILTLPVNRAAGLAVTLFLQAATQDGAVTKFSNALQLDL